MSELISINRQQWDNLLWLRSRIKWYQTKPNISKRFEGIYKGTIGNLKVA